MNSQMVNKTITLIQFAYRARKVSFGESVIVKMMSSKVKLMILATDVAPTQEKKYLEKAEFYNTKVLRIFSKQELGEIFEKEAVACIGIEDINLGKEILKINT